MFYVFGCLRGFRLHPVDCERPTAGKDGPNAVRSVHWKVSYRASMSDLAIYHSSRQRLRVASTCPRCRFFVNLGSGRAQVKQFNACLTLSPTDNRSYTKRDFTGSSAIAWDCPDPAGTARADGGRTVRGGRRGAERRDESLQPRPSPTAIA